MIDLLPGVIALLAYATVWFVVRQLQSAKSRHLARLTILEDFEQEISRQQ